MFTKKTRNVALYKKKYFILIFSIISIIYLLAISTKKSNDFFKPSIHPTQPDSDKINKIERSYRVNSSFKKPKLNIIDFDVIFQNDTPYFNYYKLRPPNNYVIHPQNMGYLLSYNFSSKQIIKVKEAVLGLAQKLPNEGLAWYYPRHYDVERMKGDFLKYSAIAQGALLLGFSKIEKFHKLDNKTSKAIFTSFLYPFTNGGVNLANKAVLEMPSFYGPPEIILNGWLDALVNIRDYIILTRDQEALQFYKNNIHFLTRVLGNFDSPNGNTSLYSDTSPYKIKILVSKSSNANTLKVSYIPKIEDFPLVQISLNDRQQKEYSLYDSHLVKSGKNEFVAFIQCNKNYKTKISAKSDFIKVNLRPGIISPYQSTPGNSGKMIELSNYANKDGISSIIIDSTSRLICGYPTNFIKNKKNFYHPYHIVLLSILSKDKNIELKQRKILQIWAKKWLLDMRRIEQQTKLSFYDPQEILNGLMKTHLNLQKLTIQEILQEK